jgi:hypothetical protein
VLGGLVALFWVGFLHQISILFYRGLVLIAIVEALCFVVLLLVRRKWPSWKVRDAVSACAFAGGIAVSFLVVFPVTIDRSISVFLLSQMAAQRDRAFTSSDVQTLFVDVYVQRYGQIERRLEEQEISGNIKSAATGYRITSQGLAFVRFARFLSIVFRTDPRFVAPAKDARTEIPPGLSQSNSR